MGTRASLAANSSSVASMSDKREVLSWIERLTNKQTNKYVAQASVQALLASSGGVFSPRQAVFERREVRILGYYTETVGREKRSPPAGPSSFLGEGRYFLLKQEMLYLHTQFPVFSCKRNCG